MRVGVVGHVEWVEFARVERVPAPGEIISASEWWEEPAGGGAVAVVQLARLAGDATLFTALGDDELGHRACAELEGLGVRMHAVFRAEPQRRGFVFVDTHGERTITLLGEKHRPRRSEPLPWDELADFDAIYFTGGDADAVRAARSARVLVATARELPTLVSARVRLDALVASSRDPAERYAGELDPPPAVVVRTSGRAGGVYHPGGGRWTAVPLPGPLADAYGAGDSFAAGLTLALGEGRDIDDAVALGARCGAEAMTRRGAHGERRA